MGWQALAKALADKLTVAGELRDPAWRAAFEQVPRHVFVPGFDLDQAYADEALVTQHRRARAPGGDGLDLPTSSASAPGVVAVMLDRLAVADGMKALEVGTGTGYNAALLSHRLGGSSVYSIDLDPALVTDASTALDTAGFSPGLRCGDGYAGWPDAAPFDRIIATCAVSHIPPAWIDQLTVGGRIVAPLLGDECALMVLDKTAEDEVTGRFDPYHVSFMPLRDEIDNPLAPGRTLGRTSVGIGQYGTTDLDPSVLDNPDRDLIMLLHLYLPGLTIGSMQGPEGSSATLSTPEATTQVARTLTDGRWTTIQYGQRLWDTAEHVVRLWDLLGKPARGRYGISAVNDPSRQYVWLDDPDSAYAWPMPL